MRKRSARLTARTAVVKHSSTDQGARAMAGWSPWAPHLACITSICAGSVGMPVEGPPRITLTTTQGTSAMMAKPMFSCLSEMPGPEEAVIAFAPATLAPMTAPMRADFVFHLDELAAQPGQPFGHQLGDLGGGRDGVAGEEAHAGGQRPLDQGLVALHQFGLAHGWASLSRLMA